MGDIHERRFLRAKLLALAAAVVFLVSCGLTSLARAEDMHDVRGTRHGCVDFSVTNAAWTTYTSASLENMQGSTALAASLYWTQIQVINGDGPVYVCEAAAANCGADSTNKLEVATGAASIDPARGLSIQSVSLTGAGLAATTGQLCGFFRVSP